ncbi:MAG: hypothetical protein M3M98_05125 [Nitrospirota bacterium]|nr:hypothetical protein [Nitrospirota bacterium]
MTLTAFRAIGFPAAVLLGGSRSLSQASGRAAALNQLTPEEQETLKPLNLRWFGYGREAAKEYWSWLKCAGLQAEKPRLLLDLIFPLMYGGALAASLWWVWVTLGRPFHPAWIVAPLAMILTADWTENLIHLAQLRHYVSSNEGRIQGLWIQISSCATIIKLWLTSGLYVSLVGLVVRMIFTLSDRRLVSDAVE